MSMHNAFWLTSCAFSIKTTGALRLFPNQALSKRLHTRQIVIETGRPSD